MPILLPKTSPFTHKDQLKANVCTKFIENGSARSSTYAYKLAFGALANSAKYTCNDVVFISAEGNRANRLHPDFVEIKKACDAKATLITDDANNRARSYNVGERQVAEFVTTQGYIETRNGVWVFKA